MKFPSISATAFVAAALTPSITQAAPTHTRRQWTVGQSVTTTGGILKGQAADSAPDVSEYLGIPFALPPVGERRFKVPVKYESEEEIDATSFGYACWQNGSPPVSDETKEDFGIPESSDLMFADLGRWPGDPGPMDEDCLTLNVWTKPQSGETKKAVLFWIHGGGFSSGSSIYPAYNGKFLADEEDVIVVSSNYRLNVLGFPGDPESEPNLGFLDVRMALEWVRDNIEAFGGDVDRITIFGQSAGAGMVDLYSFAYADDPIASGFGLLSGVADGGDPPLPRTDAVVSWQRLAGIAGCPNATADAALHDCMMSKEPRELVEPLYAPTFGVDTGMSFGPVADGVHMWESYSGRSSAEGGYLIGNTDFEAGMFLMYRPDYPDLLWRSLNDLLFTCPAAVRAKQSSSEGHPTWRYRYFGDFPNMVVTTTPKSGAWHGSELPMLFNTVNEELVANTEEQNVVGEYMRAALAAFAKDSSSGLTDYGWPEYNPLGNTLIRLAHDNSPGPNLAIGDSYDVSCIIL